MRHRVKKHTRLSGKAGAHTTATLRNLLTSFFVHKAIMTTAKRAKMIAPEVDRLIGMAKSTDPMNAIRTAMQVLYTEEASRALFEHVVPRYADRSSGFTRVTAIKLRDGDSAKLVRIELV